MKLSCPSLEPAVLVLIRIWCPTTAEGVHCYILADTDLVSGRPLSFETCLHTPDLYSCYLGYGLVVHACTTIPYSCIGILGNDCIQFWEVIADKHMTSQCIDPGAVPFNTVMGN